MYSILSQEDSLRVGSVLGEIKAKTLGKQSVFQTEVAFLLGKPFQTSEGNPNPHVLRHIIITLCFHPYKNPNKFLQIINLSFSSLNPIAPRLSFSISLKSLSPFKNQLCHCLFVWIRDGSLIFSRFASSPSSLKGF